MAREPMETLIENTTMQKFINSSGRHTQYIITPNSGYVLHDSRLDTPVFDENMEETGEVILGYTEGNVSVSVSYDFTANPYNLYAVLRSEVPENQIFGDDTDHELA